MTRQNKIFIASGLTVLAAFMTILCLFAMNGISLRTIGALATAYFFAQLTVSFFKIDSLLREKEKSARRITHRRSQLRVVKGGKAGQRVA